MKNEYRAGEGGEEAKPCVEDDCGNRLGDDDGDHDYVEGDDSDDDDDDYHEHDHDHDHLDKETKI